MAAIDDIYAQRLARLKRAIKKNGPLDHSAARLAMNGGNYDRRDAAWHNETIRKWIDLGEIEYIELANGDGLLGLK